MRPALPVLAATALLLGLLALALAQTNHTVAPGDSLDKIGRTYGVKPSDIAALNELDNPDRIAPGLVLKIPPPPGAPTPYTVRTGDTLGEIAQAHGITVATLSELNDIDDPRTLRAGQVLMIPAAGEGGSTPAPERYPLPAALRQQLDSMRVVKGKWRYVVIHHSATRRGTLQGMDLYHRQKRRMENGLAYHFVIGNGGGIPDGKIEIGDRWRKQLNGGHLASENLNAVSIGICLVGNFEVDRPTEAQMRSLHALVAYLNRRCAIPNSGVRTHKEINTKKTACPGKRFPTTTMRRNL